MFKPVTPEDAATVILTREAGDGLEVYMTRRQDQLLFLGGYHVFPGGKMDLADRCPEMIRRCRGCTPDRAVERIEGVEAPELAVGLMVAAIRELFEEAGVLLCEDAGGKPLEEPSLPRADRLARWRGELQQNRVTFLEILEEEDLYPVLARLQWFAHWITPATSPRRFSTFFFVARKPAGQKTSRFVDEVDQAVWIKPEDAIEKWKAGEWEMIPPTIASLDTISRYQSWEEIKKDFSLPPPRHKRTVWKGS